MLQSMISGATRRRCAMAVALAASLATPIGHAHSDDEMRADVREKVSAVLAIPADVAFGEYLAGDCVTCHRSSGASDGIPPIAGLPAEHIIRALVEYQLGVRDNEVMTVRVARLKNDEIAALAQHFSTKTP